MADAMVTARMSQDKKDTGNRILEQLGTNASQAVNSLYDYVIEHRQLPFSNERQKRFTQEEIRQATAWVGSIPKRRPSRFDALTTKEAKRERLAAKGLVDVWEEDGGAR